MEDYNDYYLDCHACGVGGKGMAKNECWNCGSHNVTVIGKLDKWGNLIEEEAEEED